MFDKIRGFWKQNHGNIKRGVFFRRMLLLYMVSTTVVFLGFGIVMSVSVRRNYLEQISMLNEKALFQSANACSTTLQNLYNYFYLEILESPELVEMLIADGYSQELSICFWKLNTRLTNYSNLVESCYVVNLKGGFVCSTTDTYQSLDEFYDQNVLECVEEFRDSSQIYGIVPRKVSRMEQGGETEKRYISILFRKYKEGYLVVNLDYDKFTDMVNYRNYNDTSQTLLMNDRGKVLADSNETLFAEDVTDTEYYVLLHKQEASDGRYRTVVNGSRQMIDYRINELFGLSYVTITDYQGVENNALFVKVIIYALLCVAVNLGFILAGTCFLYRPIGKLQQLIPSGDGEEEAGYDEFKLLESTFGTMKKAAREYSRSKRKRLLREIMEDKTIRDGALLEELEKVLKELDGQTFLCVNLYPDMEGTQEFQPDDLPLMKFAMENILREQLPSQIRMECVDFGNYISCILNLNLPVRAAGASDSVPDARPVPGLEEVERAFRGMQDRVLEYFHLDVTCGVGEVANSLFDIAESYEKAQMAVFFQLTKEESAILYYSELSSGQAAEQKYPASLAKGILDAVKAADKGKLRNVIPDFFQTLRHYNYYHAVKCIVMLEMDLARMEMKYDIHSDNGEWELAEGIRQGKKLYKIQEICLSHCLNAAEAYRETKDNDPNMKQIVERVKSMVEEGIADPDLTVNAIAQRVFLSTSYLRNIFKEVTGGTLSNYIIEKRLEQICKLLRETELSAQEIADRMGFSSKSYLYTFFKNYMGMTPNQYRKQLKDAAEP